MITDSTDVIVLVKSLRGIIARWAVQQSPYPTGPAHLDQVLSTVTERFKAFKGKEKFKNRSDKSIGVDAAFIGTVERTEWR